MQKRLISYAILAATAAQAGVIQDVRDAISAGNFALGESIVRSYQSAKGVTPELAEAVSWLGRGALAAQHYDQAEKYALEARKLADGLLKKQAVDNDQHLALALGAAIEVEARVMAARGERDQAVALLRAELARYGTTSIHARIQKNINLLSLEGKPAQLLKADHWIGAASPVSLLHKGRPAVIFFWAHWCGDCKAQIPVMARLKADYGGRVAFIAPTQLYGYVANGVEAGPEPELKYIDDVWRKYYSRLSGAPIPVSSENFNRYGVSTTPTLVVVDAAGIVRLYHPGDMPYEELKPYIEKAANIH